MEDIKILKGKILNFYNKLIKQSKEIPFSNTSENIEAGYWAKEFAKEFDIITVNEGKI